MTTYQNRRGSILIRPSVNVNQRVENLSLMVPASNVYSVVFRFSPVADTGGGTEFVWQYGSSVANAPSIGLRHRSALNDYIVIINTSTGSTLINIGDLTNGHHYAIAIVASGAGAATFAASHPGANGTTEIGAVYVYETFDGTNEIRTPSPTITYSSDVNLLNTLKANTGIQFRSQSGYTDSLFSDTAIITGTLLTSAQCDEFGKYTKNAGLIAAWNHYWPLHLYSSGTISRTPTGHEAYHMSDLGTGDGTSTRNLLPNSNGTDPVWSTTRLVQAIPASEDPIFGVDFGVSTLRGMDQVHRALAQEAGGTYLVMGGDSIFREISFRYGGQLLESLIDAGYTLGSLVWHWRTSFLPVKVTFPSMLGVTQKTFCNSEVGGNDFTLPSPSASDRYGLMCGGIYSITGSGVPVLGTNNRIMTIEASNAIGDATWFTDGTRIKAKVTVFFSSLANQYTGTVRFVGAGSTVDINMSASNFRQHPQDVAWSVIQAGTGGAPVNDQLNAATVLVDCGTIGTTRSVEVRLVDGLTDTKVAYIGNVQWIVCDGSGTPINGAGVVHPIVHFRDSSSFRDLWDSRVNTADGQKRCTADQLGRYLGLWIDDASARILYWQILQTENSSEIAVEGFVDSLVTRWDGVATAMNLTKSPAYMLVSHLTNNVDKDNVPADRVHCLDWRNGYRDSADAHSTVMGHASLFDWTEGYLLADAARVYNTVNGYTGFGIGEAEEVETNATLLAAIGGTADALDNNVLHPNVSAFARAATDWLVAQVESGSLIVSASGMNRSRVRNISRIRSLRI